MVVASIHQARAKEGSVSIKLHYVEQGHGMPLILLHGNGEDGSYFKHQISYFSASRRVIAIDTRGHGLSPRGTEPFTIRQFAADLDAFMTELGIARADILGFSDGGNIALVYALEHPNRVHRLIVNGANLFPSGMKAHVRITIEVEHRIACLMSPFSALAKHHAELLELMTDDPDLTPEELEGIQAPTLVIAGTRDMIKDSHTRLIAQFIPNSELVILEGDHFVAAQNPDAFNAAVARFIAR